MSFSELRTKGNQKFKSGNFGGALIHYTQCIDMNPESYALYCNRAAALIKLDSMEEAKEDLKKSLEINPDYIPSLCRLVFILLYEGNTIESLENYVRAVLVCSRERSQLNRFKSQLKEAIKLTEGRARQQGYTQDYIDDIIPDNVRIILDSYRSIPNATNTSFQAVTAETGNNTTTNSNTGTSNILPNVRTHTIGPIQITGNPRLFGQPQTTPDPGSWFQPIFGQSLPNTTTTTTTTTNTNDDGSTTININTTNEPGSSLDDDEQMDESPDASIPATTDAGNANNNTGSSSNRSGTNVPPRFSVNIGHGPSIMPGTANVQLNNHSHAIAQAQARAQAQAQAQAQAHANAMAMSQAHSRAIANHVNNAQQGQNGDNNNNNPVNPVNFGMDFARNIADVIAQQMAGGIPGANSTVQVQVRQNQRPTQVNLQTPTEQQSTEGNSNPAATPVLPGNTASTGTGTEQNHPAGNLASAFGQHIGRGISNWLNSNNNAATNTNTNNNGNQRTGRQPPPSVDDLETGDLDLD